MINKISSIVMWLTNIADAEGHPDNRIDFEIIVDNIRHDCHTVQVTAGPVHAVQPAKYQSVIEAY